MDTNFLNNKAILMFQNCQSCEVIVFFLNFNPKQVRGGGEKKWSPNIFFRRKNDKNKYSFLYTEKCPRQCSRQSSGSDPETGTILFFFCKNKKILQIMYNAFICRQQTLKHFLKYIYKGFFCKFLYLQTPPPTHTQNKFSTLMD